MSGTQSMSATDRELGKRYVLWASLAFVPFTEWAYAALRAAITGFGANDAFGWFVLVLWAYAGVFGLLGALATARFERAREFRFVASSFIAMVAPFFVVHAIRQRSHLEWVLFESALFGLAGAIGLVAAKWWVNR